MNFYSCDYTVCIGLEPDDKNALEDKVDGENSTSDSRDEKEGIESDTDKNKDKETLVVTMASEGQEKGEATSAIKDKLRHLSNRAADYIGFILRTIKICA